MIPSASADFEKCRAQGPAALPAGRFIFARWNVKGGPPRRRGTGRRGGAAGRRGRRPLRRRARGGAGCGRFVNRPYGGGRGRAGDGGRPTVGADRREGQAPPLRQRTGVGADPRATARVAPTAGTDVRDGGRPKVAPTAGDGDRRAMLGATEQWTKKADCHTSDSVTGSQ